MGWGGARPNSGPKRRKEPDGPKLATNNGRLVIPDELIEAIREMGGGKKRRDQHPELNPFQVRSFHPPNVKVPKEHQMAMDDANGWASSEWSGGTAGNYLGQVFAQGLAFPGYPFLAELSQRAEYDAFSEIIATEMTRKWIKLKGRAAKNGEPDEKADKIR